MNKNGNEQIFPEMEKATSGVMTGDTLPSLAVTGAQVGWLQDRGTHTMDMGWH